MPFLIPDLTPDNRAWRIDWFGEVAYEASFRRRSQPVYKALISPVLESAEFPVVVTDHGRQREVWLSIGTLPMVSIGDIWQNGEKIAQPDYQLESFGVRIDQKTTDFIKAGLPLDGQFLLPLDEHPWHRGATQSYCICVSIGESKRLIIPCMEIIRFYFGSSSNLLHKLFTGPLSEEMLWRDKSLDPATQHLHIKLASKIIAASASDVGRIASCKEAWRSAAGIYASCVSATSQGCIANPYTKMPFTGNTVLQANGKWLSFAGKPDSTFIAYRLQSCSHPFPFKSLSYEVDADKVQLSGPQQASAEGSDKRAFGRTRHNGNKPITTNHDPDSKKSGVMLKAFSKPKFPDLNKKSIWLEKIDISNSSGVMMKRADGSIEQLAFGEADYGGQGREANIAMVDEPREYDPSKLDLPGFVKLGIKMAIAKAADLNKQVFAKVVVAQGCSEPVFPLPRLVDEDGVIDPVTFCCNDDQTIRQRRASFLCIEDLEGCFVHYCVVIEAQKLAMPPIVAVVKSANLNAMISVILSIFNESL